MKKFGTYTDAETKRPLLLLDNRKVFTTDKTRVKAAANRNGVPMPSCSRAPETAPSGRIRRHIEDGAESDDDDIFQQPKNPQADSESEKEFVDYEPFVRQPLVINLSNLKSSGESASSAVPDRSKTSVIPVVKDEPAQRIPKKALKKHQSSSDASNSSSDSDSSEQVNFNFPSKAPCL